MVKFEKINKNLYRAVDHEELIEYVNKIITDLSGDLHNYIEPNNRELFHTVLSRALAREFFKVITIPEDVLAVLVDLDYKGVTYTSSFGVMLDPEDADKVKYVESYYIR